MIIFDYLTQIFGLLWMLSEFILLVIKRNKNSDTVKVKDKYSLTLIWISIAVSITLSVIYRDHLNIGNYNLKYNFFALIGLLFISAGIYIRYKAIFLLQKSFTVNVSVASDQKLYKKWIYSKIRHPGYLGLFMSTLGLSISFNNYLSVITCFILVFISISYRINIEEKLLIKHFGNEYLEYMKNTKKLFYKVF